MVQSADDDSGRNRSVSEEAVRIYLLNFQKLREQAAGSRCPIDERDILMNRLCGRWDALEQALAAATTVFDRQRMLFLPSFRAGANSSKIGIPKTLSPALT